MFHIDGTVCAGKGCTAIWCTATAPMTGAEISAQVKKTTIENGWVKA